MMGVRSARLLGVVTFSFLIATAAAAQSADLFVTKAAPASVSPGQNITFTVTVGNNGPDAAASVTLTDTMPTNTTFVSEMQPTGPAFTCSTPAANAFGGTVSCMIATLNSGDTATFSIVVNAPNSSAGQTVINSVSISSETPDDNTENNSSVSGTSVTGGTLADISVSKTGPQFAAPGATVVFTITVSNLGPNDAPSVTLNDTPGAGLTFVTIAQTSGPTFSCPGNAPPCTRAPLTNGSTATFNYTATVSNTPGTYTNTASVTSTNDQNPDNDSATASVTVSSADVGVAKSGPATAIAGNSFDYTITLSNSGPDEATNASFTDNLPAGVTFVAIVQNTGPSAFCSNTTTSVTCNVPSLLNGESASFTLTVQTSPSIANGTIVSNTAVATSSTTDTNANNNSSTAMTTISAQADVSILKNGPASAIAGNNVSYSITVANGGPSNAASVNWTDVLPVGTTFVSLTQNTGPAFTCTTGATISCNIATLSPGASAAFTLTVNVSPSTPAGTISNTATVTSTTPDSTPGNNSSTAVTTISANADLSIMKSGPASAFAGSNISYSITVANGGPSNAATVNWTDVLPAGTTFVSLTQTTGPTFTCTTGATISCNIATLNAGASAAFTLIVSVSPSAAAGTISNTATVTSTTPDSTPGNNSSTAVTTIAVNADVGVTKTGPVTTSSNTQVTYNVTVSNAGPSTAANVTLADTVPANMTFASESQTSGPAFSCTTPSAGGTGAISCIIASLAPGASASFQFVFNVLPGVAQGTATTNTATVSATTPDNNPANNSSSVTTTIGASIPALSPLALAMLALMVSALALFALRR